MPFRILSIDGGGLRGIVPLQILKEIRRRTNKPIVESFDIIAGTSTGGILAAALNMPQPQNSRKPLYELEEIEQLYINHGDEIFPARKTYFGRKVKVLKNFFRPKFSAEGLDRILSHYFQDYKFADLLRPVLITSYDARLYKLLFFSSRFVNRTSAGCFSARNIDVKQICRATSAAPTYLPAYSLEFTDDSGLDYSPLCFDGGVYVNNPALSAVLEVIRHQKDPLYHSYTGLNNLYVLSLGTGETQKSLTQHQGQRWGQFNWAKSAPGLMMQANSQTVDYQLRQLLKPEQYMHLNITIDKRMDDMADATDGTRNYLISKVNRDILNNTLRLDDIQSFIDAAGL